MSSTSTSFLNVANFAMAATPLLAVILTAIQFLAH